MKINNEPEPTRGVRENDVSFFNDHFDWRERNQWPIPAPPPISESKLIMPELWDPTTPAPPPLSITDVFLDARGKMQRKHGSLNIDDMLFGMNRRTRFRLMEALSLYSDIYANIARGSCGGSECGHDI